MHFVLIWPDIKSAPCGVIDTHVLTGKPYLEVAKGEQNSPRAPKEWEPRENVPHFAGYPNLFRPVT